jgi:hypothetical protein
MFLVKGLSILTSTDESILIFLANFLSQDIKMTVVQSLEGTRIFSFATLVSRLAARLTQPPN